MSDKELIPHLDWVKMQHAKELETLRAENARLLFAVIVAADELEFNGKTDSAEELRDYASDAHSTAEWLRDRLRRERDAGWDEGYRFGRGRALGDE